MDPINKWNTLIWAIFILGVSKLVYVLTGLWYSMLAMTIIGVLFVLVMKRVESRQTTWKHIIATCAVYLILGLAYDYLTQVEFTPLLMLSNAISATGFIITALSATLFIRTRDVVS